MTNEFKTYQANPEFGKTAILCRLLSEKVDIEATWGPETLTTDFYLVAEGDKSYGAAVEEFERKHEQISPNRWRAKGCDMGSVQARRATAGEVIVTRPTSATADESTVTAEAGNWIVRQAAGDDHTMVDAAFRERYIVPVESAAEMIQTIRDSRTFAPNARGW